MTAFVILAAGRGTRIGRVGESLHKALVPLEGRAILSHLYDLAPPNARIVVCVGHRAEQLESYTSLAHPDLDVTFVEVRGWDQPGGGPGHSLLAARQLVGDDRMVFTSCDTLWDHDPALWDATSSWAAVAPIPVGTTPERWCRLSADHLERVTRVLDKTPELPDVRDAYVGLASIARHDLHAFWTGVVNSDTSVEGERQVSGGLDMLAAQRALFAQHVRWTDVGDAASYRRAVIARTGYDWSKSDEATWVLPESERVVKFWNDTRSSRQRLKRMSVIGEHGVPKALGVTNHMLAYRFIPGGTMYETMRDATDVERMIEWANATVWRDVDAPREECVAACKSFYYDKTMQRIGMLRPELRAMTYDCVSRIDWPAVVERCVPVRWHGDMNFGNIIFDGSAFTAIDWRGDFAGNPWGDKRYDVAKLLVGCRVNWNNARHGDFAPWLEGAEYEDVIRAMIKPSRDVDMIAALTLINSAPLHEAPLDEILIVRAAEWMESML